MRGVMGRERVEGEGMRGVMGRERVEGEGMRGVMGRERVEGEAWKGDEERKRRWGRGTEIRMGIVRDREEGMGREWAVKKKGVWGGWALSMIILFPGDMAWCLVVWNSMSHYIVKNSMAWQWEWRGTVWYSAALSRV
jgi:hypothetical protein